MPQLPSGRRIEFSLDRFHALLQRMSRAQARVLVESLGDPDDLLFVMDTVQFSREDGAPFFAGCLASDWRSYAVDWSMADRQALLAWFASDEARAVRAEAIDYIKSRVFDRRLGAVAYPYMVQAPSGHLAAGEASRLLQ